MMSVMLYPADQLQPRLVDEVFRAEASAFAQAGADVFVVDIDLLMVDAAEACRRVQSFSGARYRGWMLSSEAYAALDGEVARRGGALVTSTAQYKAAHQLPSWYFAIAEHTPTSVWTQGQSIDDLVERTRLLKASGPVVLKDYVKSEKHRWDEAAFVPDVADESRLRAVADRLLHYRGDRFVGGFVVRDFEQFVGPEMRTWWIDGACMLTGAHPDTPDLTFDVSELGSLTTDVASLRLPFITVDVVQRVDGALRVVEIGDGQVSDRPDSVTPEKFAAALSGLS